MDSCAPPNSSSRLCYVLLRRVFAGCCEPLLEDGGSRRCLHSPCVGAWTRTPPLPPGAFARFFPGGIGLTFRTTRSAHEIPLQCNFNRETLSGLQSFLYVQAPTLARPPDCTDRWGLSPRAAGPFTPRNEPEVTLRNCGIATCLNRAIDMTGLAPAGLWPCRPLPESAENAAIRPRVAFATQWPQPCASARGALRHRDRGRGMISHSSRSSRAALRPEPVCLG